MQLPAARRPSVEFTSYRRAMGKGCAGGMNAQRPRRRAWSAPSEVEPGTGVSMQLQLMNKLTAGEVSGPEFARAWLAARRQALASGERCRESFERVLYEVFYLLDDYVIDPALRSADDITDEQLTEGVCIALEGMIALERDRD